MNINKNILIVIEPSHPHHALITKTFETKNISEALSSYQTYDLVIDLTILSTKKKLAFLKELTRTTRAPILSEMTCCFQEKIFSMYNQVVASLSTFFYSPKNSFEFYLAPHLNKSEIENFRDIIHQFYSKLNYNSIETHFIEFTFTMPRIIAQIINEAYFALDENLASAEGIDQAMIYGVNYPVGPINWAKKSGIKNILSLLEELYKYTKDNRYRPSLHLVKATFIKED